MTTPGAGEPATTPPGSPAGPGGSPPTAPIPPAPRRPGPTTAGAGPGPAHTAASVGNVLSGDWPEQAADVIVKGVDTLRDKTTGPVQKAARALVYGLLAAVLGTMVATLLIIGLVRFVDSIVGLFMDQPRIWVTYLIVGILFTIVGALVFRRRRADIL
jgi:hypothetical protein